MSCVEYENVELEGTVSKHESSAQRPKPFIVPGRRERYQDQVARRVAEVLDFELAQGSMPA